MALFWMWWFQTKVSESNKIDMFSFVFAHLLVFLDGREVTVLQMIDTV